ncbi:hypothetical protein ASE66_07900 [Bosea sp. Root483D1]|uniref:hypothetical protein n=1 Tax=Bosea sp. Root483D1 TaxID=1736544 RepID=UPI000708B5B8|nr:hypothetical protein [Bosea sp. Root483D1]KRE20751.1 hypothetical protein ASE66_07900 [Bosea sp. Root483D1]
MADDVSTRFPFINLEKALSRAELLFHADKAGKPMLVPVAFEVWGYSPKSSGGFQTVGALKGYGLLDDEGANAERRVKLSAAARRYFLDERDDVRAAMLSTFALAPSLFRALWETDGWSAGIPADTVARSHLKLERHLNDQSARALLSILKDNIQFTGLKSGVQAEASVESKLDEGGVKHPGELSKGPEMHAQKSEPIPLGVHPPPWPGQPKEPTKPIVFDMESVTVSARFDNVEDLEGFIAKLQKLVPLMPAKH